MTSWLRNSVASMDGNANNRFRRDIIQEEISQSLHQSLMVSDFNMAAFNISSSFNYVPNNQLILHACICRENSYRCSLHPKWIAIRTTQCSTMADTKKHATHYLKCISVSVLFQYLITALSTHLAHPGLKRITYDFVLIQLNHHNASLYVRYI